MQLLTITEASKITGKHPDTIRRLIKKLSKDDPYAQDNIKQELINGGFSYRIAKDYLLTHIQVPSATVEMPMQEPMHTNLHTKFTDGRQIPQENLQLPKQPHAAPQADVQTKFMPTPHTDMQAYRETIDILKEQLKQKDKQIDQLLERNRETNILLKGYQDKYLLDVPGTEQKVTKPLQTSEASNEPSSNKQHTKTNSSSKPNKSKPKKAEPLKKVEKPKKKGILSWFS